MRLVIVHSKLFLDWSEKRKKKFQTRCHTCHSYWIYARTQFQQNSLFNMHSRWIHHLFEDWKKITLQRISRTHRVNAEITDVKLIDGFFLLHLYHTLEPLHKNYPLFGWMKWMKWEDKARFSSLPIFFFFFATSTSRLFWLATNRNVSPR